MDGYGLKNRIRISNAVDKELWKQLRSLSKETMIPMSKLLDKGHRACYPGVQGCQMTAFYFCL